MSLRRLALLLCLLLPLCAVGCAHETAAERKASLYARQEMNSVPRHDNLPDYALPSAALEKARQLSRIEAVLFFGGTLWGLAQLVLLLELGVVARLRDLAVARMQNRWMQAYLFLLLFLLARVVLNLPLSLYGHHLSLAYGFSIERWGAWLGDLAKSLAIEWIIGGALVMLLFFVIRRAPRRWWLLFWAALVPIVLAGTWLEPVVVDPLFNHFEPLAPEHPALAAELEHMGVPRDRQFLMLASQKVTTPNAYVTGIGSTKRVVVWDTSLDAHGTPTPEVLWMVGHECGHFAHHDVRNGVLMALGGLLPLLGLGYWLTRWMLARFGLRWRIPGTADHAQNDWAALAVLVLAFNLLATIAGPVENAISRQVEHNADIYGEEAIHGLVPDPQRATRTACDQDGLRTFDDPNPSPAAVFWMYNHPPTGFRAAFGWAYDPWAKGMEPKYFQRR
jgi:STE24 endopeptidase